MSSARTGTQAGNTSFGTQGFPGMAPGPYSQVGNMMLGGSQNPYQQTFGGGYQGMYNNGFQAPPQQASQVSQQASQVSQDWFKTPYAQNPTATPGQTAFPGVDMNTGKLLGSQPTTQTSFTPQAQAPATSTNPTNPYGASDEYLRAFGLK